MAFEGAAWFKDEFGLLGKNAVKNSTRFVAPEALFNLDDAGSRKTIHDRHKIGQEAGQPLIDMTGGGRDSASLDSSSSDGSSNLSRRSRSTKSSGSSEDGSGSATGSG